MLEPMMPEYSHSMYLKGFTPTQIYSAFKQTQRRKQKDKKDKKREQSILEKETFAFIEKMLGVAVDEAIRWTSVLSQRFDSTSFKKVLPDLYKAYTKQVASRRFTITA